MHSIRKNGRIGTLESPGQAESRTEAELTEASTSLSLLDPLQAFRSRGVIPIKVKSASQLCHVSTSCIIMWNLCIQFRKFAKNKIRKTINIGKI